MNPAEIARDILEKDILNITAKVASGGTLTATERKLFERLSQAPKAPPAAQPAQAAAAPLPAPFVLEPETPRLTSARRAEYEARYKKGWRAIFRWVQIGRAASDPCPLDDPAAMPAWWDRRMKWTCPQEILAAAAAKGIAPPAPPSSSAPETQPAAPSPPPDRVINLADFDPEEGSRLRELKQLQSAKFSELRAAFERGADTALLESKYVKLCEAVDKIESRAIERLKKQGLYILRAEVDAAIAANAEMLRAFHESMKRRILELCPSLSAEQRLEVARAIEIARASEIPILARLHDITDQELTLALAS